MLTPALVLLLCIAALSTAALTASTSTTLNRSMLNQGELFALALENYFQNPEDVKVDKTHSSPNIDSILNVSISKQPISNISSLLASAELPGGEKINLNMSSIIGSRNIFNQPNKIFLLEGNLLLSIRYQFSTSENLTFVEAIRIAPSPYNCSQAEVMEHNNSYYLVAACLKPSINSTNATVYSYRFNESSSGFISNLIPLPPIEVQVTGNKNLCSRILLYAYDQMFIGSNKSNNRMILGCSLASNTTSILLQQLYIGRLPTGDQLMNIYSEQRIISDCMKGGIKIMEYQNGFLTLAPPMLKEFTYDPTVSASSRCNPAYMNVSGYSFVASVKERETQYIYIIFQDKILIRESYSPNYQSLVIHSGDIVNLNLQSYCIAHRFMALLYSNATNQRILVYDLTAIYPKLVNKLSSSRVNNQITLYSVFNFLENGNYFLIFNITDNTLSLNFYKGYQAEITPRDPIKAIGNVNLNLASATTSKELVVAFRFRQANDTKIVQTGQDDELTFRQVLNINLSDYVIGPLGRFYNYPNNLSAFQYINYLNEADMGRTLEQQGQSLIAFSMNNILNQPIFTLYYNYSVRTCTLNFPLATRKISFDPCEVSKRRKNSIDSPTDIVVLTQGKYLQYDGFRLQWCALSRNNEFECIRLNLGQLQSINEVILISYKHITGVVEIVSIIIYSHLEIMWVEYERDEGSSQPLTYINYYITNKQLPILKDYRILEVFIDNGYTRFLVLHVQTLSGKNHQVIVYDRPEIRRNSSSTLIGHVIQAFSLSQLQGVFCVQDLLVMIVRQNGQYLIKQYKITKSFKIRYNRYYPLYEHSLVIGGRHDQDQNFIFLQGRDETGEGSYLIYCPLMGSFNLLTHKIDPRGKEPILFAQQIGELMNSSMGLNGRSLFALTLPNLIFKLFPQKEAVQIDQRSLTPYDFNVSVIDNNNVMNILNYRFVYYEKNGRISYDLSEFKFEFNQTKNQYTLRINVTNVKGPVMGYSLNLTGNDCEGVFINYTDVFTKRQCLLYYNSQQLGSMSDFVAVQRNGENIQIVVTDLKLFCIRKRKFPSTFNKQFQSLTECRFSVFSQNILMDCYNLKLKSRSIFNLTISLKQMLNEQICEVSYEAIDVSDATWFKYDDFELMYNGEYIILEIPIRYRSNKIYFKAQMQNNIISNEYSILLGNTDSQGLQTQFQSIDTSLSSQFFFLLQDGIGIYNLNDTKKSLSPACWIPLKNLSIFMNDQELTYVKFLWMKGNLPLCEIALQIGTRTSSFDIAVTVRLNQTSTPQQTKLDCLQIIKLYEYKQLENCYNSKHSESQSYNNLIIKICNYQPPQYYVFANFISITNESTNALIQFYDKSGSSNHPFRIDLIYSNFYSNDNFQIQGNSLIVGSLFNLLCYYDLAPTVYWVIVFNKTDNKSLGDQNYRDRNCTALLVLYNNRHSLKKNLYFLYDNDQKQEEYWSYWANWLQRGIVIVIFINTLRLLFMHRKRGGIGRLRKKSTYRLHSNRFEVMVKINSKKST